MTRINFDEDRVIASCLLPGGEGRLLIYRRVAHSIESPGDPRTPEDQAASDRLWKRRIKSILSRYGPEDGECAPYLVLELARLYGATEVEFEESDFDPDALGFD